MTAKDVYKGRQISLIFPNPATKKRFEEWAGEEPLSRYIINTVKAFHEEMARKQPRLATIREELTALQQENEKFRGEIKLLKLALRQLEADNANLRRAGRGYPKINTKVFEFFEKYPTKPFTDKDLIKNLKFLDKTKIYRQLAILQDHELIKETPNGWRKNVKKE